MNALFIAGTETGVGKTILTLAIAAYWQRYFNLEHLGIFKPIDCEKVKGSPTERDAERYIRMFSLRQSPDEINPIYLPSHFVPAIAAQRTGQRIELEKAWQSFEQLQSQREFVVVEAIGSLGTPITKETTVADLAWDWRIPTILVVPVQPGAIAQTIAQVALAQQARVHLKGMILNCLQACSAEDIENFASPRLLESLTQKPVFGCIPYLADPNDRSKLMQVAAHLDLERFIPCTASAINWD